jgi:hypothetical protein
MIKLASVLLGIGSMWARIRRDGAVDFREPDDLALAHLQHIAQESLAEPAVALELDLAEFSDE